MKKMSPNSTERHHALQNSKLFELLNTFQPAEWKDFLELVQSPWFNKNTEVTSLCKLLYRHAESLDKLDKQGLWKILYPGKRFDEVQLNHLFSFLYKLGETFIGLNALESEAFYPAFYTLRSLHERKLDKHYHFLRKKTRKQSAQSAHQRAAYGDLQQFLLENLEANRVSEQAVRRYNDHVQRAADALDHFYMAEKLQLACYMLTSQVMLASNYSLHFTEDVCRHVEWRGPQAFPPGIQAYYHIFQMLLGDEKTNHFSDLKNLLAAHAGYFGREELAELYQYAINYCNLQIMKVREQYVAEALDLYTSGIESGILLQNGLLSPWHFKNVIKLALRLKKFDWTEQFIRTNIRLLEPAFRDDAFHYNLAELFYYTRRFDEAMTHLNQVEFTDVHYNLGSKVILAKIYCETEALEALGSLLHAFKTYLRRNRVISEELRQTYLNFIRFLNKIGNASPDRYSELYRQIESAAVTEKSWLLQQVQ